MSIQCTLNSVISLLLLSSSWSIVLFHYVISFGLLKHHLQHLVQITVVKLGTRGCVQHLKLWVVWPQSTSSHITSARENIVYSHFSWEQSRSLSTKMNPWNELKIKPSPTGPLSRVHRLQPLGAETRLNPVNMLYMFHPLRSPTQSE